ncbi:MAG: glucose 1-dehydrogenase [Pigmentiphaga sp.]|nr:glucose 1-dehydrogenase [Pigmentiphaga sp.]
MQQRLSGRVAVVTGGASGMGEGIARRLAAEGAQVEILDRQPADTVLAAIRAAGGQADSVLADTTDEAALAAAAAAVGERHQGRIDILVNNAGILSERKPWHELARAEVERFLQVNFMGYFLTTQAFYPLLRQSRAGRVINVASRTYFLANPGQLAYVASKGAVMGMTRVLAKEMGPENITVNAVAPGMIATPGTREYSDEAAFDRVMQNQAIRKRGEPRHLAGLVAYLASDDAELVTGQMWLCDGGGYLL